MSWYENKKRLVTGEIGDWGNWRVGDWGIGDWGIGELGNWRVGELEIGGWGELGTGDWGFGELRIVMVIGTQIEWIERSLTSLWLRCEKLHAE